MRRVYPIPGSQPSTAEAADSHPGSLGRVIGYILLALAGLASGLVIYVLLILNQPLRTQINIVDPNAVRSISLDNIKLTEASGDAVPWDQGGRTRVYVHPNFPIKKVQPKDANVENILVFGVDSRKASEVVCRADSLIVVTINKKSKAIKLTSIMRDSEVGIAGRSSPDRINAAYAYGGVGLLMNTIKETMGLDIQRFAMFDFWSAASLIDSLGGVELEISKDEIPYMNASIQEQNNLIQNARQSPLIANAGKQQVDGLQAIAWARIRKLDSDYVRTSRQRTVMMALIGKYANASISSLIGLTSNGLSAFETNLSNTDMIRIAINSLPLTNQIQEYRVPEEGLYKVNPDPWMMIVDWSKQSAALAKFIWGNP